MSDSTDNTASPQSPEDTESRNSRIIVGAGLAVAIIIAIAVVLGFTDANSDTHHAAEVAAALTEQAKNVQSVDCDATCEAIIDGTTYTVTEQEDADGDTVYGLSEKTG